MFLTSPNWTREKPSTLNITILHEHENTTILALELACLAVVRLKLALFGSSIPLRVVPFIGNIKSVWQQWYDDRSSAVPCDLEE